MKVPGHLKVGEAVREFYANEKLGREAFVDPVNYANFNGVHVPYPNLKSRREMIYLHDINHVLAEYDTSWIGEGEVAAWELASGYPGRAKIAYLYSPWSLAIGFLFSPSRMIKAFKRGRSCKNACHSPLSKEQMFSSTVAELRASLGVRF